MYEGFLFSTASLVISCLFDDSHANSYSNIMKYRIVVLICISLIISDIWASFCVCWPSVCLFKNVYLDPLLILKSSCLVFCRCWRNFLFFEINHKWQQPLFKQNFSLECSLGINTNWRKTIFFFYNYYTFYFMSFFFSALSWIYPSNSYVDVCLLKESVDSHVCEEKLNFYLIKY